MKKSARSIIISALIPCLVVGIPTVVSAGEKLPLPVYKIETSNVSCGSSGPGSDWLGRYEGAWKTKRGPLESIIIVTSVKETWEGCDAKIIASFAKTRKSDASYLHAVGSIVNGRMKFKTRNGTITGLFRKRKGKLDKTRLLFIHSKSSRMVGVRQ